MAGISRCKCGRRERGCASWRFPPIITGGAAAVPKSREALSERFERARASSPPSPAFPAKRDRAGAIIAFELKVRSTIALALLALLACASPAPAQTAADLQLVLAVDASGSVDQVRFDLQKRGYVAAFRHARVLQAIRSGPNRAIAVTLVQWTGRRCRCRRWNGAASATRKARPRLPPRSSARHEPCLAGAPRSAARSIMRRRCLQ